MVHWIKENLGFIGFCCFSLVVWGFLYEFVSVYYKTAVLTKLYNASILLSSSSSIKLL